MSSEDYRRYLHKIWKNGIITVDRGKLEMCSERGENNIISYLKIVCDSDCQRLSETHPLKLK